MGVRTHRGSDLPSPNLFFPGMQLFGCSFQACTRSDCQELVKALVQIKGGNPDLLDRSCVEKPQLTFSEWCTCARCASCMVEEDGSAWTSARRSASAYHGLVCGLHRNRDNCGSTDAGHV